MRRWFTYRLILAWSLVWLLTACDAGFSTPVAPTATTRPPSQPAGGGPISTPRPPLPKGGTLTLRLDAPIARLTPWDIKSRGEEQAIQLLYNGLTRLNEQLQPEPDLAERWDVDPNGGVLTFTLRSDLRWHDNQPLTSDDVVWTLNTLRTLTTTNSLLFDLQTLIGDVQVPISGTVVISLTQPYAPILADLSVPILPRHIFQNASLDQFAGLDFWQRPVGSGPFRLILANDEQISFERFPGYFRGPPQLELVRMVPIPDNLLAQNALSSGDLLLAEFPQTTAALTLTGRLRSGSYAENGSYWLAFNTRPERPFSDPQLRTALALALDVSALVAQATAGRGQPLATNLAPGTWSVPGLEPIGPNLDQARQLLDTAGWTVPAGAAVRSKNGQTLALQLFVRSDDPVRVAAAQAIRAAVQPLQIELTVVPSAFEPTLLAKLAPPYDFDLLLGSWVNSPNSAGFASNRFYDPDDWLLFGSDQIHQGTGDTRGGLRNIGGYQSPTYDGAARLARTTYDPAARQAAIAAAQAVVLRERPYIFLWSNRIPIVISTRLKQDGSDINLNTPNYLNTIERWYLTD